MVRKSERLRKTYQNSPKGEDTISNKKDGTKNTPERSLCTISSDESDSELEALVNQTAENVKHSLHKSGSSSMFIIDKAPIGRGQGDMFIDTGNESDKEKDNEEKALIDSSESNGESSDSEETKLSQPGPSLKKKTNE